MSRTHTLCLALACTALLLLAAGCGDDDGRRTGPPPPDAGGDTDDTGCTGPTCVDTDADVGPPDGGCPLGEVFRDGECVPVNVETPFECQIEEQDACGGDIIGRWAFTDSCEYEDTEAVTPCDEAGNYSTYFTYTEYDGEIIFTEGGGYIIDYQGTDYVVASIPFVCGGEDCAYIGRTFGYGDCSNAADACECGGDIVRDERDYDEGEFTVTATTVRFGSEPDSPYCVTGDTLYLRRWTADTYEPLLLERTQ